MNLRVNKLFFVIPALLLLVACGGLVEWPFRSDEEPVATPDIDATVEAKIKAALTAMPTVSPVPTVTPVPTATPDIVATVEAKLKDALAALPVPMDAPTPTVIPTATPTVIPTATPTPALPSASSGTFDSQELYTKFNPAVVLVQTSSGSGSGVVIGSGKQILTAAHVVTGSLQVQIRHQDHLQRSARVVNLDSFTDIALLEVDSPISIDNYPELAKSLPAVGSSVTVIGYPLGMDPPSTITQGIISNIVSDGGVTYIQFDAAVNEGNSGGPIFSQNGDLLGIVVQKIKGVGIEGIAWAVGADTVRSVLPTLLIPATPTPTTEDLANFYRVQGEKEFEDANYLRAIEYYSEAIRLSVRSPVAEDYNNRGIVYRTVGQPDKAVRDFTEAIRISGSNECIYYNNRGRTYLDQKQWDLAILDFTEAIKGATCREAYIYSNRGTASYNLGHYLDAIQDYSAAISRDPQNATYYAYRGRSYYRTEQYQSAITDLSEAIRLDRNDVASYFWRGASYYYVQQYQAAILDFTEVILSEPDNCAVYGWRSSAYYHEEKISEANRDVNTSNNLGGCSYLYPYS